MKGKRQSKLEREARKRELAALKRQDHQARVVAEKARNKTVRVERERRKREISSVVRVVTTKTCKKLESKLHEQFAEVIETSRSEIEDDLGHRLVQLEKAVESNLIHRETFSNHQSYVDKGLKKLLNKGKDLVKMMKRLM